MGVKGLWKLLEPCGRRIHVETLENTTLAVDVSIWMTQFVKAMRDEEGRPIKNAHVIGTLRRVAKLLYLGCLLYTSPSPRDATLSRMPSSA